MACSIQCLQHNIYTGDQEIKTIKVGCTGANDGCQWTGALSSLDEHTKECEYSQVICPNGCTVNQEMVRISRKGLQNHLENECVRRQYICPHCTEPGIYAERVSLHLETCPGVKVRCPQTKCEDSIPRSELEKHKSECQFEVGSCKFNELGCTKRLPRRDLIAHEEDDHQHLQKSKEKVLELTKLIEEQDKMFRAQIKQQNKDIEAIKESIGSCRRYTAPIYFRFTKFSEHKRQNKVIYSPPFYSSQGGYRLILAAWPNGNGVGKNTHVSLYVHLEKGDNDNSLTWPFKGTIVVELINQIDDKNHLKFNIAFPTDEDEEINGRVVVGGERSSGWGKARLIAHSRLVYDSKKATQYLRNDNLYFQIVVQVPGDKPWLECTT